MGSALRDGTLNSAVTICLLETASSLSAQTLKHIGILAVLFISAPGRAICHQLAKRLSQDMAEHKPRRPPARRRVNAA